MHDLVIRNANLVDGTGQPARTADIGIDGSLITSVGDSVHPGRRELDAQGFLVTPGFVDIHTHYDGQATWDPELTPSSRCRKKDLPQNGNIEPPVGSDANRQIHGSDMVV